MDSIFLPIAPHVIVTLTACLVLMIRAFGDRTTTQASSLTTLLGLGAAFVVCLARPGSEPLSAFSGMVVLDPISTVLCLLVLLSAILTVLLSMDYLKRIGIAQAEFYALLLFAVAGMMFLGSATDLVTVFLGVELMSIAVYVMVGFNRSRSESTEAALKYLILGAFASGFLLYGIALIYGATGHTNLQAIAEFSKAAGHTPVSPTLLIGVGLLIIGLAFKIGAVPFHMWVADVYQGAPTSVTAFMATAVKAAGITVVVRVFFFFFSDLMSYWVPLMQVLAILTMTVGNLAALTQTNVKRMLAYSSVAHAGYILVALVATSDQANASHALTSIFFYLIAYTVMNMGAFGVIIWLGRDKDEHEHLDSFKGLAQRRPWGAFLLALFLLALAGIPPTVGFAGKFFVFACAMRAGFTGLVIIGLLNSALSAYYYLRPIVTMYMSDPDAPEPAVEHRPAVVVALGLSAVLTLELGLNLISRLSGGTSYFEILRQYLSTMI